MHVLLVCDCRSFGEIPRRWLRAVVAKFFGRTRSGWRLLAYDNLPRKKVKFVNFAKNSLNLKADHHQGITEKLWLLIEAPKAEPAKAEPPARC